MEGTKLHTVSPKTSNPQLLLRTGTACGQSYNNSVQYGSQTTGSGSELLKFRPGKQELELNVAVRKKSKIQQTKLNPK